MRVYRRATCLGFQSTTLQDENGPTNRKCTRLIRSRVTESRDVDSHVSGTTQAGSRDQVIPRQLHTAAQTLTWLILDFAVATMTLPVRVGSTYGCGVPPYCPVGSKLWSLIDCKRPSPCSRHGCCPTTSSSVFFLDDDRVCVSIQKQMCMDSGLLRDLRGLLNGRLNADLLPLPETFWMQAASTGRV